MAKIDNEDVLDEFYSRLNLFLESSSVQAWRSEVSVLYNAMAGKQWQPEDIEKRKMQHKPMRTINRMSPIIKAIAGFEIINRAEIQVIPRRDAASQQEETDTDVMSDAIEYLQEESEFFYESSNATEDDLICGVGATVTYFDYSTKAYGELEVDRIFPGYLLYDNTCSKRNFKGAMWAGYVEIVNRKWLDKEIEDIKGEGYVKNNLGTRTTRGINDFLFFTDSTTTDDVDIIYHYEWVEYEKTYIFQNILIQLTDNPVLMDMAADFADGYNVDMSAPYITLDSTQYRAFRAMLKDYFEQGNIDVRELLDVSRGERKKFYKARIARDVVLDAEESWANDFTIQYKTGYYDEIGRRWYGLGRAMLEPQILLNKAVSDYDSYLDSVPKGGMYIEADAVEDAVQFKKSRANEHSLTLLKKGGLSKMLEKTVPQVPGGLTDFIGLNAQFLLSVIGLPPDFLGQVESGNMTNSLFGKIVKQAYMVLVHFFESNKVYMQREGRLFIDAVGILTDNYDGLVMQKVTNSGSYGEEYTLSKDSLSGDYTLKIIQRPHSEDDELEKYQQIAEMVSTLLNKPNPVDLTPLLVEEWPYELENKQQVMDLIAQQQQMAAQAQEAALQEQMNQKPDPLAQALIEAETREKIARAELNEAQALSEIKKLTSRENEVTRKETIEMGNRKLETETKTTQTQ